MPADTATVVHMLAAAARAAPGAEALVCGPDRLTYTGFVRCVAGLARELQQSGASGNRIALLLDNSVDMAIALFAVQAAGAQAVPLNPLATAAELRPILEDAAPSLVFAEPAYAHLAAPWPVRACGAGGQRLTTWQSDAGARLEPRGLPAPDALASLQYTGGTTGRAKGVELTHAAIAANILQRDSLLPSRVGCERVLSVAPLYHVYAIATGKLLKTELREEFGGRVAVRG